MMLKCLLAWFPLLLIAMLNGAVRELLYGKNMTELRAHQVSTASGCLLLGISIWAVIRYWRPENGQQAINVGLLWLVLTVCFEFIFGQFAAGHSLTRLFQDYNLFAGRVLTVFLAWIILAPCLFYV